jgi:hypothetical protein
MGTYGLSEVIQAGHRSDPVALTRNAGANLQRRVPHGTVCRARASPGVNFRRPEAQGKIPRKSPGLGRGSICVFLVDVSMGSCTQTRYQVYGCPHD